MAQICSFVEQLALARTVVFSASHENSGSIHIIQKKDLRNFVNAFILRTLNGLYLIAAI